MAGMIVKALVGVVLFVGALIGGLAATGRLDHAGTANIPLLSSLFPEPPAVDGEDPLAADAAHPAPAGEAQPAVHHGDKDTAEASDAGQGQEPSTPRRSKVGKSVVEPEQPVKDDGHGGGQAGEAAGHGETAAPHGAEPHPMPAAKSEAGHEPAPQSLPERDFDGMRRRLQSEGKTGYLPGAFFRFDGMPSGLTPEQLNEAWQRVEGVMQEIERRRTALDLREVELQELADDISRRWKELGEERLKVEQMQRQLDGKIQKFQETVTLVRNDEVALLKRNAETLAAFERSKAAELVQQQWATERGQSEVLKLMEFMDKDAINEILAELPNAMLQDILKRRLSVSKEAAPAGKRG